MQRRLRALKLRRTLAGAMVVVLGSLPASADRIPPPSITSTLSPADYVAGQAIVRFRAGIGNEQRMRALQSAGAKLLRALLVPNYAVVTITGPLDTALSRLRSVNEIDNAEPNVRLQVQSQPNDPCNALAKRSDCPSTAWHLYATAAIAAWQRFPGVFFSPGRPKSLLPSRVTIAIIDTPVAVDNVDFKNGFSSSDTTQGGQIDLASAQAFPDPVAEEAGPYLYHGTYVAGIAAASADNNYASAGVGYAADLLPLAAVHGSDGRAEASTVADAILFAHDHGARVINLSLGLTSPSSAVNDAIQHVVAAPNPSLVVAAAGNNTGDKPFYPAFFDHVMAVGGTDQLDRKATCANFSSHVSVAAPAKGVEGLSTDSYMTAPDCGTSAATPQVSGLAALLFAQDPTRSPDDVRSIIEQTADHLGTPGRNDQFGFGRINADRALAYSSDAPVTTDVTTTPVRPTGGSSTIIAHAAGVYPLAAAELYIDRVPTGAADAGYPVGPTDGDFDSTTETVGVSFNSGIATTGAHRVFIRSKDTRNIWGPLASGVLIVDGVPPVVSNLQAADTIRLLNSTSAITFDAVDDYSQSLTYSIHISDVTGVQGIVWSSGDITAPAGAQRVVWKPRAVDLPGRYSVKVSVRDEAGNQTVASTSMLLI